MNARNYVEPAEQNWRTDRAVWGIWGTPDSDLHLLESDFSGQQCLEIGCGTAYVSSWIAQRGGEAFGIDPTRNQLDTALRLNRLYKRNVHLIEGFGESLPFPNESFDFAISEYGASLWADPYKWIPEASRVLRPGAQLIFMTNHPISEICAPEDEEQPMTRTLLRPYLNMYKNEWSVPVSVEFHLPHGTWIKLLRENGFTIERLLEFGAPANAKSRYVWADSEWAQCWPTEECWVVRKN